MFGTVRTTCMHMHTEYENRDCETGCTYVYAQRVFMPERGKNIALVVESFTVVRCLSLWIRVVLSVPNQTEVDLLHTYSNPLHR